MSQFTEDDLKEISLVVGYYFWAGYNTKSFFQEYDLVFKLAQKFLAETPKDTNWEEVDFEEYLHNFIINNPLKTLK